MRRFLILLPGSLLLGGCFFGTFQTAQPLQPGEIDAGLYANVPAHVVPESKNAAIYGKYGVFPTFGGFFGVGAMKNLSVGLTANFLGLAPYAKWTFYKHPRYEFYSSVVPKLYVDVFSTSLITPEIDLLMGARVNRYFSWYLSYQLLYSITGYKYDPNFTLDTVRIPGAVRRFPYLHQYVAFGIDLSGHFKGKTGTIPYGLRLEFGGSYFYYDGKYYPFLNFGIALTGGTALGCVTLAARNPQCCMYGTLVGYQLMMKAYTTPEEDKDNEEDKEVGTGKKSKGK